MEEIFLLLMQLFIIGAFALIFMLAFFRLKPFVFHKRRKYSTLWLKLSYLGYLLLYLFILYAFVLSPMIKQNNIADQKSLYLLLLCGQIPTAAIFFRRRIKHHKLYYYIGFSILNITAALIFVFYYASQKQLLFI